MKPLLTIDEEALFAPLRVIADKVQMARYIRRFALQGLEWERLIVMASLGEWVDTSQTEELIAQHDDAVRALDSLDDLRRYGCNIIAAYLRSKETFEVFLCGF